jgi:hypothetical protein
MKYCEYLKKRRYFLHKSEERMVFQLPRVMRVVLAFLLLGHAVSKTRIHFFREYAGTPFADR